MAEPLARFGGVLATDLRDITHDAAALDAGGWWAVVLSYEGELTAARFADVRPGVLPEATWQGVPTSDWTSSMSRQEYVAAVQVTREAIAAGTVYQANICRVLSVACGDRDLLGLAGLLQRQHPSPHGGVISLPQHGVQVVSASPELFLRRVGQRLESSPIKGTGRSAADLLEKDTAENVMIVDLVRNDLGRVARPGSVTVPSLLRHEEHPGLVHLVSTVAAELREGIGWADILQATFPPGSVTGAPKHTACQLIDALERAPRGPYCGAVGWVDADTGHAELAVGIRTFWAAGGQLRFGTGAGITWGSDPQREWDETELKAERLLAIAATSTPLG